MTHAGPTVPREPCGSCPWVLTLPARSRCEVELEVLAGGLVRVRATVRNRGSEAYEVRHLEPALPVPPRPVSCWT